MQEPILGVNQSAIDPNRKIVEPSDQVTPIKKINNEKKVPSLNADTIASLTSDDLKDLLAFLD